jgi:polysaccharide biosynthesis transport protein
MEAHPNPPQPSASPLPPPREFWRTILKRKGIVITFALTLVASVTVFSFLATPMFTAKGTLAIEPEPNILSFEEIFQIEAVSDDFIQTQYKLLESRTLAEETMARLKLAENARFAGAAPGAQHTGGPAGRWKSANSFLARLKINPIPQTRLVEVRFKDPEPQLAAAALNTLFGAYVDMNVQKKQQATEQANAFLTTQITQVRSEIEASEKKLLEYGAEKNIITLGDKETTVVEKLGALNKALTEAQIDLIHKESFYNEIRSASPDNLPEAITDNELIQRLREEYVRLKGDYVKSQAVFKSDYPEMQRLKSSLDAAKTALENEMLALRKSASSDFQAALKKANSLESVFNKQKEEALQLNSNAILYNSLKNEIDNKKNLLDSLLRRQSETAVSIRLKGLRTSNIWIVDRADVPLYPSSPRKIPNIVLALLLGICGGLGLAFLFERLDSSVSDSEDVERYAGLPSLGIVPAFTRTGLRAADISGTKATSGEKAAIAEERKAGHDSVQGQGDIASIELIAHQAPESAYAEHYRSIRTTFLLEAARAQLKVVTISSALPGEGKTATVVNLGIVLAQLGHRVLLLDADLRRPRLHTIFKVQNTWGLTNTLGNGCEPRGLISPTGIRGLFLMKSGPIPPNPTDLLGSDKMGALLDELRKHFAFILVDTPPVLSVSDVAVLGPKIDANIFVVRSGKTPRQILGRARANLETHKITSLGVILNNVRHENAAYDYVKAYSKSYRKAGS